MGSNNISCIACPNTLCQARDTTIEATVKPYSVAIPTSPTMKEAREPQNLNSRGIGGIRLELAGPL
jgi:hypothetical protein